MRALAALLYDVTELGATVRALVAVEI